MFKIQANIAPSYLVDTCPPLVGENNVYNLRNAENIVLPAANKQGYTNSFFPSATRLWNSLDRDLKNKDSVDSFKYGLKKSNGPTKNKLYPKFSGAKAVNHTRLRLGLSALKSQRHDYNHVPTSTCDYCGAIKEDTLHFFLQCQVYAQPRFALLTDAMELYLSKNITFDLTRTIVKKELVSYFLKGDKRLTEAENVRLFDMVQQYIGSSMRF
jgi:hypothetical protein